MKTVVYTVKMGLIGQDVEKSVVDAQYVKIIPCLRDLNPVLGVQFPSLVL